MKIKQVEHSPLPNIYSVKTTRLIFTNQELDSLERARKILEQAEDMVTEHLIKNEGYQSNFSLSDIDFNLADCFAGQYYLGDLLEASYPNGLKI